MVVLAAAEALDRPTTQVVGLEQIQRPRVGCLAGATLPRQVPLEVEVGSAILIQAIRLVLSQLQVGLAALLPLPAGLYLVAAAETRPAQAAASVAAADLAPPTTQAAALEVTQLGEVRMHRQ